MATLTPEQAKADAPLKSEVVIFKTGTYEITREDGTVFQSGLFERGTRFEAEGRLEVRMISVASE